MTEYEWKAMIAIMRQKFAGWHVDRYLLEELLELADHLQDRQNWREPEDYWWEN